MRTLQTLVVSGVLFSQSAAEFSCGSAATTNSGRARLIVLSDCATNIVTFNADPVWAQWAASTELLYVCGTDGSLVSTGCADAANHLKFINVGSGGVPGFGCTAEGALATTDCADITFLNNYLGIGETTEVTTEAQPESSTAVPTERTTTTEGPAFDRDSLAEIGKSGKKGPDGSGMSGPLGSGSGLSSGKSKGKGKKKHKKEKGKKVSQSGMRMSTTSGAIVLVSGVAAGLVFAVATIWRAKKIAAARENGFGEEDDTQLPLLRKLTQWSRPAQHDEEYAAPTLFRSSVRSLLSKPVNPRQSYYCVSFAVW